MVQARAVIGERSGPARPAAAGRRAGGDPAERPTLAGVVAGLGRLAHELSVEDLVGHALEQLVLARPGTLAAVVEASAGPLRPLASRGWSSPPECWLRDPDHPGAGVEVAWRDADAAGTSPGSTLAATLRVRGEPWAVLFVHTTGGYQAAPDDADHLEAVAHVLASARQARLAEEEARRLTQYDPLTGLPNRATLIDRLVQEVEQPDGRLQAVVCIDIDRFEVVNDAMGHDAGDQLLADLAERLRLAAGPDDVVARYGGDKFFVLSHRRPPLVPPPAFGAPASGAEPAPASPVTPAAVLAAAERLRSSLCGLTRVGDRDLVVAASAGVAPARPGATAAELLRDADLAMTRAKDQGRGTTTLFEAPLRDRLVRRLDLEASLRAALERGELVLHYQPVFDLLDGGIHEAEALVRWADPERGLVSPADFIPIAEDSGLIVPLGQWVLDTACREARRWADQAAAHPGAPAPSVAVNLSARQISEPHLVGRLKSALEAASLDPEYLTLEITESVIMTDAEAAIVVLRRLKDLGVRLSVDDFGTGYSSLSYLKRFPVDTLKVDRSFVAGLGVDADDAAIVGATIRLADVLGLDTVAEGVETARQRDELLRLGCTRAQGYFFARPEAADVLCSRFVASAT